MATPYFPADLTNEIRACFGLKAHAASFKHLKANLRVWFFSEGRDGQEDLEKHEGHAGDAIGRQGKGTGVE
eukprot:748969-Hanusia_phi.AAC.1